MPHEGHDPLLHRNHPRRIVAGRERRRGQRPRRFRRGLPSLTLTLPNATVLLEILWTLKPSSTLSGWSRRHRDRIGKWGENPPRPRHCERVADGTMPLTMRSGRRRSGDDPQARRPAQRVIGCCSSRWGVPGDLCSAGRRSLLSQRTSSPH